jgi:hypothetical protein
VAEWKAYTFNPPYGKGMGAWLPGPRQQDGLSCADGCRVVAPVRICADAWFPGRIHFVPGGEAMQVEVRPYGQPVTKKGPLRVLSDRVRRRVRTCCTRVAGK